MREDIDMIRQHAPSVPCGCMEIDGRVFIADDGCAYHELRDRIAETFAIEMREHLPAGVVEQMPGWADRLADLAAQVAAERVQRTSDTAIWAIERLLNRLDDEVDR